MIIEQCCVGVNMHNMQQVCKQVSSTLVMVMLITWVVLRRFTEEVGFLQAESTSILCAVLVLGDEKENKNLNNKKKKPVWLLKKINK